MQRLSGNGYADQRSDFSCLYILLLLPAKALRREATVSSPAVGDILLFAAAIFKLLFLLSVIHVFVCQYVLQHEHGVLLAVPVGGLKLGEHALICRA